MRFGGRLLGPVGERQLVASLRHLTSPHLTFRAQARPWTKLLGGCANPCQTPSDTVRRLSITVCHCASPCPSCIIVDPCQTLSVTSLSAGCPSLSVTVDQLLSTTDPLLRTGTPPSPFISVQFLRVVHHCPSAELPRNGGANQLAWCKAQRKMAFATVVSILRSASGTESGLVSRPWVSNEILALIVGSSVEIPSE